MIISSSRPRRSLAVLATTSLVAGLATLGTAGAPAHAANFVVDLGQTRTATSVVAYYYPEEPIRLDTESLSFTLADELADLQIDLYDASFGVYGPYDPEDDSGEPLVSWQVGPAVWPAVLEFDVPGGVELVDEGALRFRVFGNSSTQDRVELFIQMSVSNESTNGVDYAYELNEANAFFPDGGLLGEFDPYAVYTQTVSVTDPTRVTAEWGDSITFQADPGYFEVGDAETGVDPNVSLMDVSFDNIFDGDILTALSVSASEDGSEVTVNMPASFSELYDLYEAHSLAYEIPGGPLSIDDFREWWNHLEGVFYLAVGNRDAVTTVLLPTVADTLPYDLSATASNVSYSTSGLEVTASFDVTLPGYCPNGFLFVELVPPGAEFDEGLGYEVDGLGWITYTSSGADELTFTAPSYGDFQLNFSSISVAEGDGCPVGPDNLTAPHVEFLLEVLESVAPEVDRLSGVDRFATAAEVAKQYEPFAPGEGVVYVANGLNYPDALSAAPAAAFQDAPLLLTMPNELPEVIRDEIERLDPQLIVVAGGTGVVSAAVEAELRTLAPEFRRDAGENRYETSRVLTERAFGDAGASTVFLATGLGFPDALSASAAAGQFLAPVVLVDGTKSTVDAATVSLLEDLGTTDVFIAGGPAVVSPQIQTFVDSLPFIDSVTRLAGADRYATSQVINNELFDDSAAVYLAVGTGFADALAGAALAGKVEAPLFVVPGNCVPDGVLVKIAALGATEVVLLGGVNALSVEVFNLTRC